MIRQVGTHEPGFATDPNVAVALTALGVEPFVAVDLHLHTATGLRVVRIEPGDHAYDSADPVSETRHDPAADAKPGAVGRALAGERWRHLSGQSKDDAPWLEGLHRLSDPSALTRFVTSRTLYRRIGRYAWWILAPFVALGLLRVAVSPWLLQHLGSGVPGRALRSARQARWDDQAEVAALFAVAVLIARHRGARTPEPPNVVDTRGRRPQVGHLGSRGQRHRSGERSPAGGPWLCRPDHRGHLPVRAHQSRGRVLRQRGGHRRSGGGTSGEAGPAADLPPPTATQLDRVGDRRRPPRAPPAGGDRSPVPEPPRTDAERRARRSRPPPDSGGVLPKGGLVASRPQPPIGPPANPPGSADRLVRHPVRRTGRRPRRHHSPAPGSAARIARVPPPPGHRRRRDPGRPGRPGPHRPRPRHSAGPTTGLAGGVGAPECHPGPPPSGRRRYRGVPPGADRLGGAGGQSATNSRPAPTGPRCGRRSWPC